MDYRLGNHNLFSSHTSCPGDLKIRIAYGFLSFVAGKGNVVISKNLILNFLLHVPNL